MWTKLPEIIRSIALLCFVAVSFTAKSQDVSYIYEGRNWDPSRIVGNVWGGVLIEGDYPDLSYALLATDGRHIYSGSSTSAFDLLYTLREDNKLYLGDSRFLSDIVCTIRGPHIYLGDSQNSLDLVYTYRGSHIFEGDGVNMLDVVLTIDPPVSMMEAVMILLAAEML
jgi:hypothetical protein